SLSNALAIKKLSGWKKVCKKRSTGGRPADLQKPHHKFHNRRCKRTTVSRIKYKMPEVRPNPGISTFTKEAIRINSHGLRLCFYQLNLALSSIRRLAVPEPPPRPQPPPVDVNWPNRPEFRLETGEP